MGDTTVQIEHHIEKTRDQLGANLQELEQRVGEATDWRHHYRNHPMAAVGIAFGGGILLATMMSGPRRAAPLQPGRPISPHKVKASETWDQIKYALMGVAAARVTALVGDLVPGFADEFRSRANPTQ